MSHRLKELNALAEGAADFLQAYLEDGQLAVVVVFDEQLNKSTARAVPATCTHCWAKRLRDIADELDRLGGCIDVAPS